MEGISKISLDHFPSSATLACFHSLSPFGRFENAKYGGNKDAPQSAAGIADATFPPSLHSPAAFFFFWEFQCPQANGGHLLLVMSPKGVNHLFSQYSSEFKVRHIQKLQFTLKTSLFVPFIAKIEFDFFRKHFFFFYGRQCKAFCPWISIFTASAASNRAGRQLTANACKRECPSPFAEMVSSQPAIPLTTSSTSRPSARLPKIGRSGAKRWAMGSGQPSTPTS